MCIPFSGNSQSTFHLASGFSTQQVTLNGVSYTVDSIGLDITTNYPDFDTLYFDQGKERPILCNFKPNGEYYVSPACCATLDIIPRAKLDALWDNYEWIEDDFLDMERIKSYTQDFPTFSFELTEPTEDSIFFWTADYSCEPKIMLATTEVKNYGHSYKCFYWSNITTLQFYTYPEAQETQVYEGEEYHFLPDYEKIGDLGKIVVRLFDDHHFKVTLNTETGEVYLRYDD